MSKFGKFACTAPPWFFSVVCGIVGLNMAAKNKPEDTIVWVVIISSGLILMTLFLVIVVQLQVLKTLEEKKKETAGAS